jgi:hypothetical protein
MTICPYCEHPEHEGSMCQCSVADGCGGYPCGCISDIETMLALAPVKEHVRG